MKPIPSQLLHGPFSREVALEAGLTPRRLEGRVFVRLHPRVYRHRDHEMSDADWRAAARLAMPVHAHLTGISRLQALGLDYGPTLPVRFVVAGTLHLALPGTFLHRTRELAPQDDGGICPAGAFLAYCARARVIDAIKVGDWLLANGHTTADDIERLALSALWRDGAHEAIWVLTHLTERSRSLPESETRALLTFAGVSPLEPNGPIRCGNVVLHGDLVETRSRTVVEYEGSHHQEDRGQYLTDVDRYALFREHDIGYVQVTKERLRHPRQLVTAVYAVLTARGYHGPEPDFGDTWALLFSRLSVAVGPRRDRAVS